jgi:hypothetical protein
MLKQYEKIAVKWALIDELGKWRVAHVSPMCPLLDSMIDQHQRVPVEMLLHEPSRALPSCSVLPGNHLRPPSSAEHYRRPAFPVASFDPRISLWPSRASGPRTQPLSNHTRPDDPGSFSDHAGISSRHWYSRSSTLPNLLSLTVSSSRTS